ncbi:hypothetical protein M5E84_02130 [[Ruminococcus] torques]|nr:hypothetical protein M5E84_02130 [[Ruminococcus] torques]
MSLNSRIIKALEPMKLKVTVSEHPVNDEEGKPQQPDAFLVIIPERMISLYVQMTDQSWRQRKLNWHFTAKEII